MPNANKMATVVKEVKETIITKAENRGQHFTSDLPRSGFDLWAALGTGRRLRIASDEL